MWARRGRRKEAEPLPAVRALHLPRGDLPERPRSHQVTAGAFLQRRLLRPSFLDGLRKTRTWLEQDLERESRGAAGREQMPRLPEVCVRVGQIRCFGHIEAKPFELIDPPQEALAVRTRLKLSTTLCFAVLHLP
jgi:hypothetical protein